VVALTASYAYSVAVKNFTAKNRNTLCAHVLTSLAIQLYCTAADKILLYHMMRIHLDEYRISAARNVTKIRTTTSSNVISLAQMLLDNANQCANEVMELVGVGER
jgi:hypothetical protein